jgi:Zn-dependent alcohol dehydrogenase
MKTRAAGLWHSDLSVINGDRPRPMPMIICHEGAGEVADVGAGPAARSACVAEEGTIKGSYVGSCDPARDIPRYIELYRAGRLPIDRLLSERIALDQLNEGFDRLADGLTVRQILTL